MAGPSEKASPAGAAFHPGPVTVIPSSGAELPRAPSDSPENSPVDSFAIDYIITFEAAPQNEPRLGGVPIMRVSIIDPSAFSGHMTVLRSR